ncbi:ribosome assembly RNA-binding protein YhbY [Aliibacillus thermotolerans]|uniref:Ribosome assembly RNA-binding protein YhbY n=1 Tax=Aliibacillus thermotolerans TaxID=1834418 RepID=A0ABW0U9W5_9BACI|nr:ribosome assembly RNA-binding protein YhbY [Aliibacillus thermotolerans]MDA3130772.1 ribosome assembly RNA-binding protein YhbY [Aliibacillus thermotolerans]
MLTNKQKRFLRKEAHRLKPVVQVGKSGVNENVIQTTKEAIEARELIKVNVLQNCLERKEDVAHTLAENIKAEIVQVIGNIIILYKESKENKQIELPQ